MKNMLSKHVVFYFILLSPVSIVSAQDTGQTSSVLNNAIGYAGGVDTWHDKGALFVHEFQKRYEEGGVIIVDVTHTMNTDGSGYRMELTSQGIEFVYGWDGSGFWALVDGKPGTDDDVSEARRQISNAYFRFSLPFILERELGELTYEGTDSLYGASTEVLKITYDTGLAGRYFAEETGGHDEHSGSDASQHASEAEHDSGSEHQAEGGHGGGHHHGGEEYLFHFAQNGELKKVYFSHHGDGTYETLLYKNNKMVSGIVRDHIRVLLNPEGNIHYESFFSQIRFIGDVGPETFKKP